jgi:hypothetical protein
MLTIQYLEDSSELAGMDRSQVIERLQAAVEQLPITHLLIGWHLPSALLDACRRAADRLGLRFLRWQPLLTTDKEIQLDPSWQVEGLAGHKVAGYRGLPEFTFTCPNHPDAQEAVREHLEALAHLGIYQGFFLDRIRFPSPSPDPMVSLACFCEHCCRKAGEDGLDLVEARASIMRLMQEENARISFVKILLSGGSGRAETADEHSLHQFMSFRQKSVRDFLELAIRPLNDADVEIGLDAFSPCLTSMVGQDLVEMGKLVDWVKLMTYAHTLAPAGLPYELLGWVHYLIRSTHLGETQALELVSQSTRLQLPPGCHELEVNGLAPLDLEKEVQRGIESISQPVLAGVELVDLLGVTRLSPSQIRADLAAIQRARPSGLALSWDLLHIPLERLELVRPYFYGEN